MRKKSKKSTRGSRKTTSGSKSISKSKSRRGGSNEKIIYEYVKNLDKQLTEKNLYSFCVFPELNGSSGFKNKLKNVSGKEVKKIIKDNPGKYSYMACINLNTLHDGRNSIPGKAGVWITASIPITPIDKDGNLMTKKGWGINMHWKEEDLKITKFSIKLMEVLVNAAVNHKLSLAGTYGVPFHELIHRLKIQKIDISEHFIPLPGLEKN